MLTKEFAQEVAHIVFNMLEAKWDARRLAAIERKEEEERQKEIEKQRKLEERANRVPAKAVDMVAALAQAVDKNGGKPVSEKKWKQALAENMPTLTPAYVRVLFYRYKRLLEIKGHVQCENRLYSVKNVPFYE